MAVPKTRIRHAKIYLPPDDFGTTTARGIGWRAECACGWRSRPSHSLAVLRRARDAHAAYHEASPRVSVSGPV